MKEENRTKTIYSSSLRRYTNFKIILCVTFHCGSPLKRTLVLRNLKADTCESLVVKTATDKSLGLSAYDTSFISLSFWASVHHSNKQHVQHITKCAMFSRSARGNTD